MADARFFKIRRERSMAHVHVPGPVEYEMIFTHEMSNPMHAQLVVDEANRRMSAMVESLARRMYLAGYRDAKSKIKKRDWFPTWLVEDP